MAKKTIFFNDKNLVLRLKKGVQFALAKTEQAPQNHWTPEPFIACHCVFDNLAWLSVGPAMQSWGIATSFKYFITT